MESNVDDEDIASDTDVIAAAERELKKMYQVSVTPNNKTNTKSGEKRMRENSDDSNEEGFITVMKNRRQKRLLKSDSVEGINSQDLILTMGSENEAMNEKNEVCLTSLNMLPKQMAFAKLLANEKIEGISSIKYKSSFKLFINFNMREQAEKLITNHKLKELGIRSQFTDQIMLSYGLIKGVDLDMSEQEFIESLKTSCEIISVKRLKRLENDGKWIDSETVRICFKSTSCPQYVHAFGCRFPVEKYIFPVTQCSKCWRYGHIKKFCPNNKDICPKCGQQHVNCEIETFTCLNCKGSHMAFDKVCPQYRKERKIRVIMCERNVPYRKALEIFQKTDVFIRINKLRESEQTEIDNNDNTSLTSNQIPSTPAQKLLYSTVCRNDSDDIKHVEKTEISLNEKKSQQKQKRVKKSCKENPSTSMEVEHNSLESEGESSEDEKERDVKKNAKRLKLQRIIKRITEIMLDEKNTFVEKICLLFKILFDECKSFIMNLINSGGLLSAIFNYG